MPTCLVEAQVIPSGDKPRQKISMFHTAVLAFVYMSPRTTPSGKMLEMLYTEINNAERDAELRCLRAMTAFKDRKAYAETLPIVLHSLHVSDAFGRSIDAILRKQTTEDNSLLHLHSEAPGNTAACPRPSL